MELINTIIDSGPGTGKTEYMKNQIEGCLLEGMHPSFILGFTFTNAAARNMKDRLKEFEGVAVYNIHSYCMTKLNHMVDLIPDDILNYIVSLLVSKTEKLKISATTITNLMDIWRTYIFKVNEKGTYKDYVFSVINKANINGFLESEDALNYMKSKYYKESPEYIATVINRVINLLIRVYDLGYVDFTDLIIQGYYNISDSTVQYCMVDEFQDLTYLEYRFITNISNQAKYLFLGDTNQGIYSWRHSNYYGNKVHFEEHFGKLREMELTDNYRCSKEVLALSNYATNRNDYPMCDIEGKVVCENHTTNAGWRDLLVDKCKEFNMQQSDRTMALLVQSNAQAGELVNALKQEKVKVYHKIRNNYNEVPFIRLFLKLGSIVQRPFSTKDLISLCSDEYYISLFGMDMIQMLGFFRREVSAELYYMGENSLLHSEQEGVTYVVFDTETTGTDYDSDDIIQIGAVKLNSKLEEIDRLDIYMKTNKDLTASESVHNISEAYLEEHGIQPEEGLTKALAFFKGSIMVAHNTNFDRSILENNCIRYGLYDKLDVEWWMDTLDLARTHLKSLKPDNYKLGTLAELLKFKTTPNHNAMFDVEATVELLQYITKHVRDTFDFSLLESSEVGYVATVLNEVYSYDLTDIRVILDMCEKLTPTYDSKEIIFRDNFKHVISLLIDKGFSLPSILEFFWLKNELEEDTFNITVCTVHQSKGLEFDDVIYVQEYNSRESSDNNNVEVVALSRAKISFTLFNVGAKRSCRLGDLINGYQNEPKSDVMAF